jgi:hypothetical protein
MTADKPVKVPPAGLRHVRFILKAVRVPVALARKICPKELVLKQLNNVKGSVRLMPISQVGGVGSVGYVS